MRRPAADERFWHLVDAACQGGLAVAESRELESWLGGKPDFCRTYLDYCQLHTDLNLFVCGEQALDGVRLELNQQAVADAPLAPGGPPPAAGAAGESPPGTQSAATQSAATQSAATRSGQSPVLGFLGIAAHWSTAWLSSSKALALAVVTGLATYFVGLVISIAIERAREQRAIHEPAVSAAHAPARVIADAGCRWTRRSPAANGELPPGADRSSLAEGVVELEFSAGARVRIEGPAEFAARSGGLLDLARGRLLAYVPRQARGFTVTTPTAEVIDRGTEFEVEVDPRGNTDVQVRKGNVEVEPTAKTAAMRSRKSVAAGQAVRVGVDDLQPVSVEFSATRFAAVRSTVEGAPADKLAAEQFVKGQPIWLGNLFDDRPFTPLAEAMLTDTFKAVPKARATLGVERVFHNGKAYGSDDGMAFWDGGGKLQIAPGVVFDLTNLGWKGMRSGAISNDAYTQYEDLPGGIVQPTGGISTRNTVPVAQDSPKIEEGIGMQADAMLTFDLDAIRAAGNLTGRKLVFWSERAGINDGHQGLREEASVYMLVVVSDRDGEIVGAQLNGKAARLAKQGDAWSVEPPIGKPISGLDEPVSFAVRIPADAKYLTLITTVAGDTNYMDIAVWSGACLKAVR